jgi:tetratricopeptide (TPR) repeat protein
MTKKNLPSISSTNLPRPLRNRLGEADKLLSQGNPQEALNLLHELDNKFPRHPDVLGLMANAHLDTGNQHGYLHTIHRLHELTPNRADVKVGLAGAYLANGYLALALKTFRQFLKHWSHDDRASDVQKTVQQLEKGLGEILAELGDTSASGYEFACQHEELMLMMEAGNYSRCRQLAKKLLQQRPTFAPILNNMSQVEWLEGNLAQAIEMSRKVLEIEPQNVHALSNLTRYLFMQGKKDEASMVAEQLKNSATPAADRWVKKAEALSFIEDDEGVLALIDQAKQAEEMDELSGVIWHWCAVAEYQKGNIPKARAYWQKCAKLVPYFELANTNLGELKKPLHERICPQAFSLENWIPRKTLETLTSATERAARKKNDEAFRTGAVEYFDRHPEFIQFVTAALTSGDEMSRELALQLADMSAHPAIFDFLKAFSLGQKGPDSLRLDASQILTKHGVFKSGEMVELWLEGEWKQIMMMGFQISYDPPKRPTLKPAAQHLMEKAIYALRERKGAEAETHLRKALEIQKDEPGLLNNLAVALSMQGKHAEAEEIADEIPVRFPDYFFGQVIAARRAIQAGELEKAKPILNKMMQKQEMHVTEFGALCACQIDFMIEDDKPEGAISWFEMWQQGYPDDPALKNYEERMSIAGLLTTFKKGLSRSRRKSKKRDNY